ncbi:hypothetical protein [Cellulosimicrobium arenosum]|uniref:DUF4126 domain-containing protein n=1 Tax=Cellulosimicrobium arenosum TaxID=2708133 RepID=A0A927J058_9MICO|nr:hypothetical protein [Cellulosimicrobium arenosum]MBD8079360.1 hypothetical protein [Cellulosimicrobium arenosum]
MPGDPSLVPTLVRAVALGAAAGARATLGVAAPVLASAVAPGAGGSDGATARWRTAGRAAAGLAVVGELVGDKLPRTPSRLEGTGPAGRLVSGAVGGVLLARRRGQGSVAGLAAAAAAGATGAAAGTWGGAAWRRLAVDHGRDWPRAIVEDASAIALAAWATTR